MSIFDWSLTAASNGNADATINFQEGQAPSTVNDSARALMARMAFYRNWSAGNMTQGGSSNAYTITSGESLTAYTNGMRFLWKPNANSSGAVTLNVDGLGAKKVYLPSGVQAGSGSIDADAVYDVVYQSALDSANGGFKIVGGGAEALGLGTAAYKNTGTSGDAVPLLNAANTWSGAQSVSNGTGLARMNANGDLNAGRGNGEGYVFVGDTPFSTYLGWDGTKYVAGAATLWHSANDGAGSGLDADTLDGVQESALAKLAGAAFSGAVTVPAGSALLPGLSGTGDEDSGLEISSNVVRICTGGARRVLTASFGMYPATDDLLPLGISGASWSDLFLASGAVINFAASNFTITHSSGNLAFSGAISARVSASAETTGTLTVASANRSIQAVGNITINNSVFAAGDIILIYAGASARTITQGSGVTMRLDGTATTGSRTLAARGVAMLFFVSASEVIVAGGAVT